MRVVADDFTGAAEIAAVAHARGLSCVLSRRRFKRSETTGPCIVLDTDTRLKPPHLAHQTVLQAAQDIPLDSAVFKKTDSVLRGNVVAECIALATQLQKPRIILLPQNPNAGRCISQGVYSVHGKLLDQTEFAKDPTHPANSSNAVDLLSSDSEWPIFSASVDDHSLPENGIIICDASSNQEVMRWSERLLTTDLAAGGREFFNAFLSRTSKTAQTHAAPPLQIPNSPLRIVLQGTLSPAREKNLEQLTPNAFSLLEIDLPSKIRLSDTALAAKLEAAAGENRTIVLRFSRHASKLDLASTSREIEAHLSNFSDWLKSRLANKQEQVHLLVEGGATAARVLDKLGIDSLEVNGALAEGVVTLSTQTEPLLTLTCKPGSYDWPPALLAHFSRVYSTH